MRPTPFLKELAFRLKRLWWLKALGTCLFMMGFFHLYFLIMHAPSGAVHVLSASALDQAIKFEPLWFYAYASLWVYASLVPALMPNFLSLLTYGIFIGAVCLIGLLVFYFVPTAVPYDTSQYANAILLKPLHDIDQTGNAFPSLHVACALFSALTLNDVLRQLDSPKVMRWINAMWCGAIVYSTLAIKQHTLLDVAGGAVLALGVYACYRHYSAVSIPLADRHQ